MANLGGDALDRTANDSESCEESGMPVAWYNLCGNRFWFQTKTRTDKCLDFGINVSEGPDRSRTFAKGDFLLCLEQAFTAAMHLSVPVGHFQTKGNGLGMDAVRATNHHGILMLTGQYLQYFQKGIEIGLQEICRFAQLHSEASVYHVG